MRIGNIVVVAAIMALVPTGRAATVYTEEGSTLVATVSSAAETNEFDSTYAAKLVSNDYAAFEKRGPGGLFMPADLSGYTGSVTVRMGALGYRTSTSLGSLAPGNGDVTVIDEATLFIPDNRTDPGVGVNSISPVGKSFNLAGMGVDGAGAVDLRSEQQRCPLGTNITLTAETRIRNRTQYYWGHQWDGREYRCRLDMGGYTLRLCSEASSPDFKMVNVSNPGDIVLERNFFQLTGSRLGGSAANELRLEYSVNNSAFNLFASGYECLWTLVAGYTDGLCIYGLNDSSYSATFNAYPGVTTNANIWLGPVDLRGKKMVNILSRTAEHGGVAFLGKVTGGADLRVWGNRKDDGTIDHHPYLNLVNPANDFTGNMTVRFGGVRLWNPGAIGNPGKITLEEGEVAFDNLCDDFGALPPLVADCSSNKFNNVWMPFRNELRFGRGRWSSVVKTGPEPLWWFSGTGSDSLSVQEGFVKLPRRAMIAGLYSAQSNVYNSSTARWALYPYAKNWCRRDLEPGVRSPNCRSHAYQNYNYKPDPSQSGDAQYAVTIYSGYVWNNSATNETWSFAGGGGKLYRLTVGGTLVYDIDRSSDPLAFGHGNATLAPGPNTFELVTYRTSKMDSYAVASMTGWTNAELNFAYDPLGRDSCVQSDYRRMEDPGDGSLFTFCLPGEDIVYPRHEGEVRRWTQPDFANIAFADGTGLDLEGCTNYVMASFSGWPVVTNATCLAVTNRWTIPVSGMLGGQKRFSTDGRLDLSAATICFDDPTSLPVDDEAIHGICYAAGGITGVPRLEADANGRWTLRIASDGRTLELWRQPAGTCLIFK
ncbi:MAG: hypothetical protein IKO72_06285 [Kiritimatiellae bacterium]|nr:hypothetical protein [Kiritimatiellia bacterium]